MKLTYETLRDENDKLTNNLWINIEDKNKDKVLKIVKLLEDKYFENVGISEDDRKWGGTFLESFIIERDELKDFKRFYKEFKKEI
jgi:predicted Zn-dependent protease with MMP-like domain